MKYTEQLRQLLGLSGEDTLDVLLDVSVPSSDMDLGFSGEPLWDHIAHAPEADLVEPGLPIEVRRWDRQAGVFKVTLRDGDSVLELDGACVSFEANSWWFDVRGARASIAVELASGDQLALVLEAERIAVARAQRHFACPTLNALRAAELADPWLRDLFEQAAQSPVRLERAAAVGYVFRHSHLGGAGCVVADLVDTGRQLRAAVDSWFCSLGRGIQHELLEDALVQCEQLRTGLLELDQADAVGEAELGAVVEHLCLERERLESAREVFRTSCDEALSRAIERVDFEAEQHIARIAGVSVDNELLRAVAELQPEAWWGLA